MLTFDRIHRQCRHIKILKYAKSNLSRDPLPVRRYFVQRITAIINAERFDPVIAVLGEIVECKRCAMLFRKGDYFFGELTPVKCITLALSDLPEGSGLIGEGESFSG